MTAPVDPARRVGAACALSGVTAGAAAAYFTQDDAIRPAAMVNLASSDPLAALVRAGDPHFPLVNAVQHYDGVYYYAIARDPVLAGRAHTLIDQAAYRYGHPLHGWLAAVLSLGRPGAIPAALFALSLIGLGATGWLVSRLAVALGASPWLGLLAAGSPGLLYSVTVSTTEALGAALVVGALLAWQQERFALAGVVMVAACLDKEQYLAVPVGLAAWELARRPVSATSLRTRVAALMVAPVPLALWYVYVHARLHRWPFQYQSGNLGWPVRGWLQTFDYARALAGGSFEQSEIGTVVTSVLLAVAALLIAASVRALWLHSTALHLPFALLALITSCQGWRTLLYPHELVRTPAVAVLLALLVLLTPGVRAAGSTPVPTQP